VLVAGGQGGTTIFLKSAELYDPATGIWPAGNLATGRQKHEATLLLNGKVLVTGGAGSGYTALASAELCDPNQTPIAWTNANSMATRRTGHSATLLANGKVLVAGGYFTDNTVYPAVTTMHSSCELYDPDTGQWSPAGSLPMGWANHQAVRLQNGKVLIVGGTMGGDAYLANAALYDPDADRWTPTGGMSVGRYGHTITLLNDGKVLVTGSITPGINTPCLASCELYDPEAGVWSPAPSMLTARAGHTATLLRNGDVLVAGGGTDKTADRYLASAEIYQIPRKAVVAPLLFLLFGN
jgi:N-acetylneuraminic acid mutarotase